MAFSENCILIYIKLQKSAGLPITFIYSLHGIQEPKTAEIEARKSQPYSFM
jgi:hypothetical protein